mgnify:CR=1 FL=1
MSTGCREAPDTCEAAPGRSTDMPQMLLSFTHLRSIFFLKKYFFLEITFKKGPDELTAALSAAHEEEDTYVI